MIPDTGFPRVGGMAKEGHRKRKFDHGANTSISYNTCIRSTGDRLGIIPLKRAFLGQFEFVEGSRHSHDVEEVVIHVS